MTDIEHELRQYRDTTEEPHDQDALAELVAALASEAHAAAVAVPADPETTCDDEIPF